MGATEHQLLSWCEGCSRSTGSERTEEEKVGEGALCNPRRSCNKQVSLVETVANGAGHKNGQTPPFASYQNKCSHLGTASTPKPSLYGAQRVERIERPCHACSLAGLKLRSTLLAQWSEAWAPLLKYHASQSRHGLLHLTMPQCLLLEALRTILPLLAKV